jgi:hypothetical protein
MPQSHRPVLGPTRRPNGPKLDLINALCSILHPHFTVARELGLSAGAPVASMNLHELCLSRKRWLRANAGFAYQLRCCGEVENRGLIFISYFVDFGLLIPAGCYGTASTANTHAKPDPPKPGVRSLHDYTLARCHRHKGNSAQKHRRLSAKEA